MAAMAVPHGSCTGARGPTSTSVACLVQWTLSPRALSTSHLFPYWVDDLRPACPYALGCHTDLIALQRMHVRVEIILTGPFCTAPVYNNC